jgi:hypothetical protein
MTADKISRAASRLEVGQALARAAALLVSRLDVLDARLLRGEESVWIEFYDASRTLVALAQELTPGRNGALLTTAELAARLGCEPKTILRQRKAGALTPAVARGKFLRWRADQMPGGTGNGTMASKPALNAAGHGPGRAVRARSAP